MRSHPFLAYAVIRRLDGRRRVGLVEAVCQCVVVAFGLLLIVPFVVALVANLIGQIL